MVANAAFLAEKTAREAAESKLTTLRRSLSHKDELIKSLKTKVGRPSLDTVLVPSRRACDCAAFQLVVTEIAAALYVSPCFQF